MGSEVKTEDVNQSNELEQIGMFWVPESPDAACPGTLRFRNELGIELEILGGLLGERGLLPRPRKIKIILGRLKDGTEVTLQECAPTNTDFGEGGISQQFKCIHLFLGIATPELDTAFNKVELQLTNFASWLGMPLIERSFELNENKLKQVQYKLTAQNAMTWNPPGLKFRVDFTFPWTTKTRAVGDVRLRVSPVAMMVFESCQPLDELRDLSFRFQNLISLLVGEPCRLLRCCVYAGEQRVIWLRHMTFESAKEVDSFRMFSPFQSVSEQFESTLLKWFQHYEELTPVFDLFFASLYHPDQFVQTKFTQHVQAIEVFHRRKLMDIDPKHAEAVKRSIKKIQVALKDEPVDLVGRICGAVGFCKEPGLSERISDLLKIVDPDLRERFIGDEIEFVKLVRDLRNYLTHYAGGKKKAEPVGPSEMMLIAEQLRVLLFVVILKEVVVFNAKVKESVIQKFHHLQDWRLRIAAEKAIASSLAP